MPYKRPELPQLIKLTCEALDVLPILSRLIRRAINAALKERLAWVRTGAVNALDCSSGTVEDDSFAAESYARCTH